MTAKDYLRITLLFPYAGWFILGIITSKELGFHLPDYMEEAVFLYTIGIFIWFIPYTLLALVLRKWSTNKEEKQILKNFAFAPMYLALIFYFIIFFPIVIHTIIQAIDTKRFDFFDFNIPTSTPDLLAVNIFPIYSILFGYFFVAIAFIIYKFLKHNNKFRNEQIDNSGELTS